MKHTHKLTQISDKVYAPIEWLDTLIPNELRLLANPYKEFPFTYFNVDWALMLSCNLSKTKRQTPTR